jgi:virginiamycin B lyase
MRLHLRFQFALRVCIVPTVLAGALAGCSHSSTPTQGQNGPVWGFPFKAGTLVTLGAYGLHDDNYHGLPDYNLSNAALPDSALDIVPVDQSAPTPVIPVAAGTILAVAPACHFVFIDHGNGIWVGYQHLDLNPSLGVHSPVYRSTTLGYTAAAPIKSPNCEYSSARHVHFAFLRGDDTTKIGSFVTMIGRMLCGHKVTTSPPVPPVATDPEGGAIEGLASAPGARFPIPPESQCSGSSGATQQATPTPRALSGTITEYLLHNETPGTITAGPDGRMWFSDIFGSQIGHITPDGKISYGPLPAQDAPSDNPPDPYGLTTGSDGSVWYTEYNYSKIGRISSNGDAALFAIPSGNSALFIVAGSGGTMWFSEQKAAVVGRITTDGAVTEFPVANLKASITSLAAAPDGSVWFSEFTADHVGRMAPDGQVTEFPTPDAGAALAIAVGPDGNIWFTTDHGLWRMTSSGTPIGPEIPAHTSFGGLVAGPDGNMWAYDGVHMYQIGMSGQVQTFTIPTPDTHSAPLSMAASQDGTLWFVEPDNNKLGHIT